MPRKGENIRKRTDGRWEGRFKIIDPVSGVQKYRSIYARTYREVKTKLADARQKESVLQQSHIQQSGERNDHQKKVEDYYIGDIAEMWLLSMRQNRKYSTYIKYKSIYECHIKDEFYALDMKSFTSESLEQLLDKHQVQDGSVETSIYCVANQIISFTNGRYGLQLGRIQKKKSSKKRKPVEILNRAEQQQLLQTLYCDMDLNKFGILLCLSLGLRLGEICALKWADIDPVNKLLYVNRTVQRIAAEGRESRTILLESEPKSIYSKRTIPLTNELLIFMQQFGQEGEYVISKTKPTEPRTYEYRFHKILADAGIHKCNFHILRHTFATNCVDAGIDIKSLSEILGHADVNITLNRYVHPSMETKRQHLNDLSAIYGQFRGQKQPQCE